MSAGAVLSTLVALLLGAVVAALVSGAGLLVARPFGWRGTRRCGAIGLAPGLGCATFAVLGSWGTHARVPMVLLGAMLVGLGVLGLARAGREVGGWDRRTVGLLLAALLIPLLMLASAP